MCSFFYLFKIILAIQKCCRQSRVRSAPNCMEFSANIIALNIALPHIYTISKQTKLFAQNPHIGLTAHFCAILFVGCIRSFYSVLQSLDVPWCLSFSIYNLALPLFIRFVLYSLLIYLKRYTNSMYRKQSIFFCHQYIIGHWYESSILSLTLNKLMLFQTRFNQSVNMDQYYYVLSFIPWKILNFFLFFEVKTSI